MRHYLQFIRLPAGFSALSNVLAAHIIVTAGEIQALPLLLTALASLCFYYGGMGLNDCFDYQEDCRHRANRPLPAGRISLRNGWILSIALILLGLVFSAALGLHTLLFGLLLAATIVLYNSKYFRHLAAAVTMGLCRYLNWLLALSIVPLSIDLVLLPLPLFFYVTALTLLSQCETSTEKRYVLYQSLTLFACSVLVIAAMVVESGRFWPLASVGVLLFIAFLSQIFLPLLRDFTPSRVQGSIAGLVMGVIIVDAVVLLTQGFPVFSVCILLLLLPGKALGKRLYVS